MDIIRLIQSFQTQDQAVEHLENVRWGGRPLCPYCGSDDIGRHASPDRKGRRWQCHECTRAFSVTVGTLFHGTHVPLRDWFLVLALMLNAKNAPSAYQIARDLGIRRPTVWSMMERVRAAMASDPVQEKLLLGIVENDPTSMIVKRQKVNHRDDDGSNTGEGGSRSTAGREQRRTVTVSKPGTVSENIIAKFIARFIHPDWNTLRYRQSYLSRRVKNRVLRACRHTAGTVERVWRGCHDRALGLKYMPVSLAAAYIHHGQRKTKSALPNSFHIFLRVSA